MRHRNWDVRLVRELGPVRGTEVEWGETDCVSLCLRALEAMYPPDDLPAPRKSNRPTWTTKTGAVRVLNREPPFHEVLLKHGCRETKLSLAQNGDIVTGLWPDGEMPGYGVVSEQGVWHVDIETETVVWHRLRWLREGDFSGTVVRPPHG